MSTYIVRTPYEIFTIDDHSSIGRSILRELQNLEGSPEPHYRRKTYTPNTTQGLKSQPVFSTWYNGTNKKWK